jgi:hypothetical protein
VRADSLKLRAAVALAIGILVLLVVFVPAVRVLVGLLLVLELPGAALTAAMFPPGQLGAFERLLYGLGLSLALAVLAGFALHWTPWGLQAASWVTLLAGIALAATVVAYRRGWRAPLSGRFVSPLELERAKASMAAGRWDAATQLLEQLAAQEATPPRRRDMRQVVLLGLAALLTVTAIGVARAGAAEPRAPGFTQVWLLPDGGTDQAVLHVGVHSEERAITSYRLAVAVDGVAVLDWQVADLQPGEARETVIWLPPPPVGGDTVVATLTPLHGSATDTRRVTLWRS